MPADMRAWGGGDLAIRPSEVLVVLILEKMTHLPCPPAESGTGDLGRLPFDDRKAR